LKLNDAYQLVVNAGDVNKLGRGIHTIKKNTEALLFLSKEVGLEVSFEKMKYTHIFLSTDCNK